MKVISIVVAVVFSTLDIAPQIHHRIKQTMVIYILLLYYYKITKWAQFFTVALDIKKGSEL